MHWPSAPGVMIALVAIAVLPILLTLPETAPAMNRSAVRRP
jgi:MHS family proline/betaine transporter-like MFS transporter